MGKQMVRCPRAGRVAVPAAMIHLLSCGTVDHGRSVFSRQHAVARPPKSVTVSHLRTDYFDHPPLGQQLEALDVVVALDDLQDPPTEAEDPCDQLPRIAAVGPDALHPRPPALDLRPGKDEL